MAKAKSTNTVGLRVVKRKDGYWITGKLPTVYRAEYGPYDCREEAEDDRRGLERTYLHENEPGYVTIDGSIRQPDSNEPVLDDYDSLFESEL